MTLKSLGHTTYAEGGPSEARAIYEKVAALDREWNFAWDLGFALAWIARAAYGQGDYAAAQTTAEQLLSHAKRIGNMQNIAQAQDELARVAICQGDLKAASWHSIESLRSWVEVQHIWGIAEALESRAYLALARNQAARAVLLLGATSMLRERGWFHLRPWEHIEQEQSLSRARAALPTDKFMLAWQTGFAMTMEQAIEYALADIE